VGLVDKMANEPKKENEPAENLAENKPIKISNINDPEIQKRLEEKHAENLDKKPKKNTNPDISPPRYQTEYGITEQDVLRCLQDNEDGDAALYIKLCFKKYLFDHLEKKWYYWNDHHWRFDGLQHRYQLIKDVLNIYHEQASVEYEKAAIKEGQGKDGEKHKSTAKLLEKRKRDLQTLSRKNSVLEIATQGLKTLGYHGNDWDTKPHKLGVRNGIIDLLKGTFDGTGTGQDDYIKTVSPTVWKGIDEPCPEWEKFLKNTFAGRPAIPNFLQRLLGYSLRGDTPEHIFPIFHGEEGRNGKGTLLETLKFVLGPLAYKAPAEFLLTKPGSQQNADAPSATKMKLRGARLVWCSETNEGDRIDAAKLKEMVGGDTVSARAPYGKGQIEFEPTHTLFIMTNKKPRMPPNDTPLWRRIFLIEFNRTFVDNPDPNNPNEVQMDRKLKEKLQAEASGILAWLVRGAILYQSKGLCPPQEILDATNQYRADEDILGHFLTECCVIGDPNNQAYKETAKDLYESYKSWCGEVGHHAMSRTKFRKNLLLCKKMIERPDGPQRTRKIFGIALISNFSTW